MTGILKVDQIAEANLGQGVRLNHTLKNSSDTEIISAVGTISNATLDSTVTFPAGNIVNFSQGYSTTNTEKTLSSSYGATDTSVTLSDITTGNSIYIIYSFLADVDGDIHSTIYVDSTDDLALSGDVALTQTTDAGSGRFLVNSVGSVFYTSTSTSHTFTIYAKTVVTPCSIRDDRIKSQIMAMEIQV